ncbi:MAG: rRNA (cytosine1402-N4)-methyltransferase [Clostridia bacterium]|jgi:16S rRNA (cytosine1402-N4)-methyltransferase|nr:rRNA (cytosine1402-N4)-methyltransferase [Clostridia bacterium]
MNFEHVPVLLNEIIDILNPQPGDIFVDCTLGGGGHSKAILERTLPHGYLIGIDQDLNALNAARKNLSRYKDNIIFVHSNYKNLDEIISKYSPEGINGILFDLGVSSHQLDEKERGFSYMQDAPLDMRMNQTNSFSARDLINSYSEEMLADIIKEYGEERWAKRIAQFIVQARNKKSIETTGELVEIIKAAIPARARKDGPHPAKRTFQAIRIAVNEELDVLEQALDIAVKWLKKGGKIGVISFHSLEDRIVKERFKYLAQKCVCPSEIPICQCNKKALIKILTRKPVVANKEELATNPRARSAKFRAAVKL